MPKHTGLLKRGNRFYVNLRVPKDLRALYGGKEAFRKSLGTSDWKEAVGLVRYEAFKLDSEFRAKRLAAEAQKQSSTLRTIGNREAHEMVFSWFVEQEKLSENWNFETGSKMDEHEREEVLDVLREDAAVYSGGGEHFRAANASDDLEAFLKTSGQECPPDSPAYRLLLGLFTKARLENIQRDIARLSGKTIVPIEPLFQEVFAHTNVTFPRRHFSVGEMIQRFLKALKDGKRSGGTLRTYEVPCRLLKEALGEKTSVTTVTKDQIAKLFDLLRKAPANATKRYRGLTLEEAVEAAEKVGDPHRLGAKTLENYYNNIVTIFHFAVEQEMIQKNPAKDRWLRASFERSGPPKRKTQFSPEEMNKLFRSSVFMPSLGDSHKKKSILRSGKAWVPLLSLFHGLRCNEAAQLYTEDVKMENGIPFIEIREEREDGSASEKRLKTEQSKRRVPIHPEVLKMGFLDFVTERQPDPDHPRLFPDLRPAATGYFSDAFGKWFGRLVKTSVGEHCDATFHSFRHQFRDALTEAGVSIPDVERLGGWELMNRSSERLYGQGPSLKRLRQQIQKVKFSGLDLRHFYAVS